MKKLLIILFLLVTATVSAQIGIIDYDTIQSKSIQADSAFWMEYLENQVSDSIVVLSNGKFYFMTPEQIAKMHLESNRIEQLASRNLSVTFLNSFNKRPIGEEPQVYRVKSFNGNYRREGVLWGWADTNQPSTTGFELNIDNSENLDNVIIEYAFVETFKPWILKTGYWNKQGIWDNNATWNIP
jgi:hypothetical protein